MKALLTFALTVVFKLPREESMLHRMQTSLDMAITQLFPVVKVARGTLNALARFGSIFFVFLFGKMFWQKRRRSESSLKTEAHTPCGPQSGIGYPDAQISQTKRQPTNMETALQVNREDEPNSVEEQCEQLEAIRNLCFWENLMFKGRDTNKVTPTQKVEALLKPPAERKAQGPELEKEARLKWSLVYGLFI